VLVDQQPHQFRNRHSGVGYRLVEWRWRSGKEASDRPSLKWVAKYLAGWRSRKNTVCLSRSSLPWGVESSGYSTRDRFFASNWSCTAAA